MGGSVKTVVAILAAGFLTLALASTADAGLLNGSFESGNFSGFTQSAFISSTGGPTTGGPTYQTYVAAQATGTAKADTNGVVTSQTTAFDGLGTMSAAIAPTSGNYLAFLSNETSAGNATLTGSSISQTFTVPAGATALTFDARLLNNDQSSAFVTYDDFGGVALTQGTTVLGQYNLDLNPASAADGHVTAAAAAGGFLNSTAWLSSSFSLASLTGQNVTLTAYSLTYGGDNSVETRLLLDNIQAGSIVTPEPVASGLVSLLILGGLRYRRTRNLPSA